MLDQSDIEVAIYEAALVPDRWPLALDSIAQAIGAKGGVFFGVSSVATNWTASPSIRDDMEYFVSSGWAQRSTRMAIGFQRGLHYLPRFVTEIDYGNSISEEPVYREFFHPRGLGHSAGTIVILPHEDMLCVSFEQSLERGPFSPNDLARLDALRPHLMRASLISTRLGLERVRSAVETLTALGLPAAAVTTAGVVIEANPHFDRVSVWTTRGGNRIALNDVVADRMLRDVLSRITSDGSNCSIPLRDPATRELRAVMQVIPLRRAALDVFGSTAAILVLTEPRIDRDLSLLPCLFDLTPSEVDVAQGLIEGKSLAEIAKGRRRSLSTVKNQLASVLQKTGCSRQLDLVLLLSNLLRPGSTPALNSPTVHSPFGS